MQSQAQHSLLMGDECRRCLSQDSTQVQVGPTTSDQHRPDLPDADQRSSEHCSVSAHQSTTGSVPNTQLHKSHRSTQYEMYVSEEDDEDEEEDVNERAQLTGGGAKSAHAIIVASPNRVNSPLLLNSFVMETDQKRASTETRILMEPSMRESVLVRPSPPSSLTCPSHTDRSPCKSPIQSPHSPNSHPRQIPHHHHYQNHLPAVCSPLHSNSAVSKSVSDRPSLSVSPTGLVPSQSQSSPINSAPPQPVAVPCQSALLLASMSSNVLPTVPSESVSSTRHHQRVSSCISVQSGSSQCSSDSSLSDYPPNTPICKFCHQRARTNDPLISPCYCKGTIRYMHCRCLMKWLDKLKKRNSRNHPLSCEICNYEYRWRKKFKPAALWQLPPCSSNDRRWHTVFVVCALLMIVSMINLVVFGEEDSRHRMRHVSVTESASQSRPSVDSFLKPSSALGTFFAKNNDSSIWLNISESNSQDMSILLANLSAALPALQNMNLIPNRIQTKQGHHSRKKALASSASSASPLPPTFESDSHHRQQSYDFRLNNERRRRRNLPTKPSEVILVVSGCLFFVTFFLGTFAQIKSEVSFYTLVVRFVHWNQQWIIEEYDPDETLNLPPNNGGCTGTGSDVAGGLASNNSDGNGALLASNGLVMEHESPAGTASPATSSCDSLTGIHQSNVKDNQSESNESSFGLNSGSVMGPSGAGKLHVIDL